MGLENNDALLVYLLVLIVLAGAFLLGDLRNRLTQSLQHAMIWVVIFMSVVALYSLRDTIFAELRPTQAVQNDGGPIILKRARDGHRPRPVGHRSAGPRMGRLQRRPPGDLDRTTRTPRPRAPR